MSNPPCVACIGTGKNIVHGHPCTVCSGAGTPPKKLQDWQQQVVDYLSELDGRIGRLEAFHVAGAAALLPMEDRFLLGEQLAVMRRLQDVLRRRVERFSLDPTEAMVIYRRDRVPCDADPMGRGFEDVAIPAARLIDGIPALRNTDRQRLTFLTRAELDAQYPDMKRA